MPMKHNFHGFINRDHLNPVPLVIYDLGFEIRKNEIYDYDNRLRENYNGFLVQYTFRGQGVFETAEKQHVQNPGSGFIIPVPHDSRYYLPEEPDSQWEYFYIHFDGHLAQQIYKQIYEIAGNTFTLPASNPAIQLFEEEYNALEHGKYYKRFEAGAFMYNFLTTLLREIAYPESPSSFIDEAISIFGSKYAADLSMSDICQQLGISQAHFSRTFHRETGISPIEYLTNVRLERSMHLLATTELSISEISTLCGFDNANYYAKVFRRKLGMSPTEYRTNH